MSESIDPERPWIVMALAAAKAMVAKGLLSKEDILAQIPPTSGETLRISEDEIIRVAREMVGEW
jgi:hypothetical protein